MQFTDIKKVKNPISTTVSVHVKTKTYLVPGVSVSDAATAEET